MSNRFRLPLSLLIMVIALVSISSVAFAQSTVTFTNPGGITIPNSGNANPYPSTIAVSGVNGTVLDVNVTINGFSHTFLADVDMALVGPTGQIVRLTTDQGGSQDATNANVTFDDEAAGTINGALSGTVSVQPGTTGTYSGGGLPGPVTNGLSQFDSLLANGTWMLYVYDDLAGDQGSISGGWSITFTYQGVTITVPVTLVTVTPKFKDGRVNDNTNAKDLGAPVAIFCDVRNGITVLFTEGDRAGDLAVNVSASRIDSVRVPADSNVTLGQANGVIVSRLTTSEYQVNASYADGKPYVVAWIGCPVTSFTNLAG